jgi:hypothetical protein
MLAYVDRKGEKEAVGLCKLKMGQLTLSMGLARVKVCFFVQIATIPGRGFFELFLTFLNTTHAINTYNIRACIFVCPKKYILSSAG